MHSGRATSLVLCLAFLAGCGNSDGNYTLLPAEQGYYVVLDDAQVIGGGDPDASATASLAFNSDTGVLRGTVVLSGFTANSASLMQGYAGESGTLLRAFIADSADQWSLPEALVLSEAQVNQLDAGRLYIEVSSPGYSNGAVRGQILPDGVAVYFTDLSGTEVVPSVTTNGSAMAAMTLDTVNQTLTSHVNTANLTGAASTTINQAAIGSNGPMLADFVQDAGNATHWSLVDFLLTQAQYDALQNGELYYLVTTSAFPGGEVRGQIGVSEIIDPTLTSVQNNVFTPACATSGCHKGKVPSAGLDLTAGNAWAAIVNVGSVQVPTLLLVSPGDSANSYLMQKIQGTAASGGQMPVRGSLTPAQVLSIQQWIDSGAPDN
jgi:hypothetical protein